MDVRDDLAGGVRALRRSIGFSCLVILVLGLGVGVNALFFAIADAVVFQPFPFPNADRLVIAGENLIAPRSEITFETSSRGENSRRHSSPWPQWVHRAGHGDCGPPDGVMPNDLPFPPATDLWTAVVPELASIAASVPNLPPDGGDVGVFYVVGGLHAAGPARS